MGQPHPAGNDRNDQLLRLDGRATHGLGRLQREDDRRLHRECLRPEHDLSGRRLVQYDVETDVVRQCHE